MFSFDKPSVADVRSGFLIFLIALPLCLGISMASGTPPIAGVFTAMVGAIVASFTGSSRLTIKGPAAGMIVIVLGAVQELGHGDPMAGYKAMLAVGVAAAIIQMIFGRMKLGKLGNLIPPSVVHGMLAAIGVIIIAKQIHILLGVAPHAKVPLDLLAEIPNSLMNANPRIAALGLLTVSMLFFIPVLPSRLTKKLPPALLALLLVVPLGVLWHMDANQSYEFMGKTYELGPKFLVQIPSSILGSVTFPDFSALSTLAGWKFVLMFALVGSIESVLTVSAVDSLDPYKRNSDLDKDLFSVGLANLVSASIGGLPMISEIVRSKANIDNGAQSSWSNFFHGVFLLVAITVIPGIIHEIPLAALAAMLIITGFRLSSPKEFAKVGKIGLDQLMLFVTTMVVTLATDLLLGVAAGIVLKVVLHWYRGMRLAHILKVSTQVMHDSAVAVIRVEGAAVFTNFLHLRACIQEALVKSERVVLDFSQATLVDHTTLERLHSLSREIKNGTIEITGLNLLKGTTSHELSTRRIS